MNYEHYDPYNKQFWGNTQKHSPGTYFDRWMLGGFIIGPDEELMIIRHPIDFIQTDYHDEATVESQTGLNIKIDDLRPGIANLKLSKAHDPANGNNGNFLETIDYGADGTKTVLGRIDHNGVTLAASLAVFKDNMKDLTDNQILTILEKLPVYRFNYKRSPDQVHVSPEAAEFNSITKWGDGETLSPMTIAGIALRCVKWVWQKVKGFEERLTQIEAKLSISQPESEPTGEPEPESEPTPEPEPEE